MCKEYGTEDLFNVDVGNRNSKYFILENCQTIKQPEK